MFIVVYEEQFDWLMICHMKMRQTCDDTHATDGHRYQFNDSLTRETKSMTCIVQRQHDEKYHSKCSVDSAVCLEILGQARISSDLLLKCHVLERRHLLVPANHQYI